METRRSIQNAPFKKDSVTVFFFVVVVVSYLPSIAGRGCFHDTRIGPLIDEVFAYDGPLGCQPLPGFPQEKWWHGKVGYIHVCCWDLCCMHLQCMVCIYLIIFIYTDIYYTMIGCTIGYRDVNMLWCIWCNLAISNDIEKTMCSATCVASLIAKVRSLCIAW